MRLRSLHLERFGHFNDRRFDFGPLGDRPDFHIIYGGNEAGKTTLMEGALRLFYGFPHIEPYGFKHQRRNLRVSGMIEAGGTARHFSRLPTRQGDLVDENETALPEAALAMHLGGFSEDEYRNLLCLDDETIERGGEEIAHARGEIGKLLFSAAAGIEDLSTVLDNVRADADALWRRRASTTKMAQLRRQLTEISSEIRQRDLSVSKWAGLRKALADAHQAESNARNARDGLHRRVAVVALQRRALPLLTEIDRLATEVTPHDSLPARLDIDPENLVRMLADDRAARDAKTRLTAEIEQKQAQREAVARSPALLGLADQLAALDELQSRDVTARLDLDRRRAEVANARAAMSRAAAALGVAGDVAEALVLTPTEITRLNDASDLCRNGATAAQAALDEVTTLKQRIDQAQTLLGRLRQAAPDAQPVSEALARFDIDHLAPAEAQARQAISDADAKLHDALFALGRGAVRFETLPDCPYDTDTAQGFSNQLYDLQQKIARAEDALATDQGEVAATKAQLNSLSAQGALVSDADAARLKTTRDRLWQDHRATLSGPTADAFAAAMHDVDAAAQTRLNQAGELARLRQTEQARAAAQARLDATKLRLESLQAEQARLQGKVDAMAGLMGLPVPMPADAWLEWLRQLDGARIAAHQLETVRRTYAATQERAARLLAVLCPLLDLDAPDFAMAVNAARKRAAQERDARHDITKAEAALQALQDDLQQRQARHDTAQAAADAAKADWVALVGKVLQNRVAADVLMASLDPLRALREHDGLRRTAQQRVERMENDQKAFETAVQQLAAEYGLPQGTGFADLQERARAAQEAEAKYRDLTSQIDDLTKARQASQQNIDAIARQVAAMGAIFPAGTPVGTLTDLRQAVLQTQHIIDKREALGRMQRDLLHETSAPDLAAARQMLEGVTPAALEVEAATLKTDLDDAEAALTRATETRADAETALKQVTGDADLAKLNEQRVTLEMELKEAAFAHLRLSFGHQLAEEAIRRYRDKHRSTMMEATEASFAALTRGAYSKLITQPDGDSEVLLAVDATGATKRVAEMSKGTRFQLYLALRAAAHAQLVAQGTCLPFFCDDIFETFDEERTSAACRVMERIGRSGQAIYLTHHRHVVEIASKVCDTVPFIHEID